MKSISKQQTPYPDFLLNNDFSDSDTEIRASRNWEIRIDLICGAFYTKLSAA